MDKLMTEVTRQAPILRTLKIAISLTLLPLTLAITGCGCGVLSKDAWSGGGNCARLQREEQAAREQQSQRELPALKKRADDGDMQAQVAMGQFHMSGHHPNSVRATGLAYFDKAGRQGNLQAQHIFLSETHQDCRSKALKLGQKEADGPQYAPYCTAEWLAMETLALKACVRTSRHIDSSIQVKLGEAFDQAGKSDDADFWYVAAITYCLTPAERSQTGMSSVLINPRTDGRPHQVRGAMWLGVRGRQNFPHIPLGTPEVEASATARLSMLQAKVARSGIRPAL